MNTKRFFKNKLIRDNMLEVFKKEGSIPTYTELKDDNDFLEAVTQKLIEEMQEVFSSEDLNELIEELADFEAVLEEFKALLKIDQKTIDAARAKKLAEKGGFKKRILLEHIDVPVSNKELIEYYEEEDERAPEFDLESLGIEDDEEDEE